MTDPFYQLPAAASFGGLAVAQNWAEFPFWEELLNREIQLRALYELGSWQGGFTRFLEQQAKVRGLRFHSFDLYPPVAPLPHEIWSQRDVLRSSEQLGRLFREHEPCLVFCDNGAKPVELLLYSEQLDDYESLLVVHDWGDEIGSDDVPANLQMVNEDLSQRWHSMSRCFKIRPTTSVQ